MHTRYVYETYTLMRDSDIYNYICLTNRYKKSDYLNPIW